MFGATRALASIAGPRRDVQKAEGQETGGQDDGLMTGQGAPVAESIAVDGAQRRGAEDARVSDVQRIQEFGGRASSSSGGITGTVARGDAAEDVGARIDDDGNIASGIKSYRKKHHKRGAEAAARRRQKQTERRRAQGGKPNTEE